MARILIIDDEDQVRSMLRHMLERAGHEVIDAPDGTAAARLYRASPADIVITDLLMPEKDGLETIVELRHEFPNARIIAVSGGGATGRLDFLPTAQYLGAVRTFHKPFRRLEILAAIDAILAEPPPAGTPDHRAEGHDPADQPS